MDSIEGVAAELRNLTISVGKIEQSCKAISEAQQSATELLARLDERHKSVSVTVERAHERIDVTEGRVTRLEMEQPVTQLVTRTITQLITRVIIGGALGVLGIIGTAFWGTQRIAERPVQIVIDRAVIERVTRPPQQ